MNNFIAHGGIEKIADSYKIHTFTESGNFVVDSGTSYLDILVVAGGGSGGINKEDGGGGGGVVQTKTKGMVRPGSYSVTVGLGGIFPESGKDSFAFGIRAIGGSSGNNELGVASWSAGSDKSSFSTDFSGELKRYAGSGGNNLSGTKEAADSGQYQNGGGGGFGNSGSGFDGVVIIKYKL